MKYREVETEKLWDNLRMLTFAEVVTAFGEIESQLEQEKLMREIDRRDWENEYHGVKNNLDYTKERIKELELIVKGLVCLNKTRDD